MPDYQEIYHSHAAQYERLVEREDYHHNILHVLQQIVAFDGLTVAEFGAGTGRLTCLLAPVVKFIDAYDASQHMLDIAVTKLRQSGLRNWRVGVSDHRHIPLGDAVADIAISGWSICYLVVEHHDTWQRELQQALDEMRRVVGSGGIVILLETLGTGHKTPNPPAGLVPYYEFLQAQGFRHTWIRTDFQFKNMAEAEELTRFFFGDAMVDKIELDEQGILLPECTGIWWSKPETIISTMA